MTPPPTPKRYPVDPGRIETILSAVVNPAGVADVPAVDGEGWVAWCVAGVELFGDDPVGLAEVKRRAASVVAVRAMDRERGNVTRAAASLGISRRSLREALKAAGRYPWESLGAGSEGSEGPPTGYDDVAAYRQPTPTHHD
ncbi:MAG: helix-turn-helix domain-containing protein [Nannocystaceae bacterium]